MKQYVAMDDPPITVRKLMMGSPSINNPGAFENVPIVSQCDLDSSQKNKLNLRHQTRVIETYPQMIGYDSEVFEYFLEQ